LEPFEKRKEIYSLKIKEGALMKVNENFVVVQHITLFVKDRIPHIIDSLARLKSWLGLRKEDSYVVLIIGKGTDNNTRLQTSELTPFYVNWTRENGLKSILETLVLAYTDVENLEISLMPFASGKEAYLVSSQVYHTFKDSIWNDYHIWRPIDSGWKCFDANCRYKPQGFDFDKKCLLMGE
jgi:hypothetical protein